VRGEPGDRTDSYRVTVARSLEELDALRSGWEQLQGDSVSTEPDYFTEIVRNDPAVLRPHVVLLEQSSEPVAMAVARLERVPLPCRIGYATVWAPVVRSLSVAYEGLLGKVDGDAGELLLATLRSALSADEADVVVFRRLRTTSPLNLLARDYVPFPLRSHMVRPEPCWALDLPATYEEFWLSLSTRFRKGLRLDQNRLRRDFGDALTLRQFRRPEELGDFMHQVEAIAARTYQRALGKGLRDDRATRARARLSMERGWFRGFLLVLEGKPVAFEHGDVYRGRYQLGVPGYDPDYRWYGVGMVLQLRMIEELCADPTVSLLDMGFGDADYKRRLGNRSWQEAEVVVYAARLRPLLINAARSGCAAASAALVAVVQRAGLLGDLKTRWRRRLARQRLGKTEPAGA
jgi:CelD/BcsL family acetyltransferase involved in cellulose biosynthesis